ncbi:MAG TPA: hypothetical protein VLK85_06815 [Ramlibacter sp.]|nr:hypothetical protein [Ramlibacter sp.]
MSTLAEIRAAIVAKHQAVPNVGVVHDRERYTREETKFRELFVTTPAGADKQVRGWWWRRVATRETTVSTGTVMNVHTWECRGYMALADAESSELAFDALIEAFRDAVRADPTLGGVCEQNAMEGEEDGVQVMDAGPVLFCGVLCHSAVLQLKTWSYL